MQRSQRDLPTEIWISIVSFLDGSSLRKLSIVCRRWYQISNDRNLWERICKFNGFAPLIQDIGDESSATTSTIDWKRVFVRGLRTRERNAFFDIMIRRTSDQTLFNISMSQIPEEAMNITNFGRCEECVREESAEEGTNLDYLSTSSPSRLHSLLWDHNFHEYSQPRSRSDFLRHTLKLGCIWADSPRVKVPKEFLLDYNRMNFRRRAARGRPSRDTALLDIDLSSLALGSSPSSSLGSYPSLSSSPF